MSDVSCYGEPELTELFDGLSSSTTYLERLLVQALHGPAERGLSYIIGAKALQDSLDGFEEKKMGRFQRLVTEYHEGEDPDDAFSTVSRCLACSAFLHKEILTVPPLPHQVPYEK